MPKAKSVTLDNKFFAKKDDLTGYMREMVSRYAVGDFLEPSDFGFCMALFRWHPKYPLKLEPGVIKIQILIQEKGSVGFQIHKTNGSTDNISWTDCVTNIK